VFKVLKDGNTNFCHQNGGLLVKKGLKMPD
jgi:hypothetical protein